MRQFCLVFLFFWGLGTPAMAQVDPFDPVTPWPVDTGRDVFQWQLLEGAWLTQTPQKELWTLHLQLGSAEAFTPQQEFIFKKQ